MAKEDIYPHQQLIEHCKHNNRLAQAELYHLYVKAMHNTAYRMLKDTADAEDVVQQAFIKAFTQLHSFTFAATFGSWLKRIVVNAAIDHLNKRKKLAELYENASYDTLLTNAEEDEVEWPATVEQTRAALLELPTGYRTVLSLYLLEGYDHYEIAEILNISVNTSLTQYSRGKRKLTALVHQKLAHGRA